MKVWLVMEPDADPYTNPSVAAVAVTREGAERIARERGFDMDEIEEWDVQHG